MQVNQTKDKSNANKNLRTYLLYMKKRVSAFDEKVTKKDINKSISFILQLWDFWFELQSGPKFQSVF